MNVISHRGHQFIQPEGVTDRFEVRSPDGKTYHIGKAKNHITFLAIEALFEWMDEAERKGH